MAIYMRGPGVLLVCVASPCSVLFLAHRCHRPFGLYSCALDLLLLDIHPQVARIWVDDSLNHVARYERSRFHGVGDHLPDDPGVADSAVLLVLCGAATAAGRESRLSTRVDMGCCGRTAPRLLVRIGEHHDIASERLALHPQ
jgi:hypothetical protein